MQGLADAKADGRAIKTGDHSKRKANADAKRAAKLLVATAAQAGAHDHTKEVRAGRKKCRKWAAILAAPLPRERTCFNFMSTRRSHHN